MSDRRTEGGAVIVGPVASLRVVGTSRVAAGPFHFHGGTMNEAFGHLVWFVIGFCVCAAAHGREPDSMQKRRLIAEWTSQLDDETRLRARQASEARRRARG